MNTDPVEIKFEINNDELEQQSKKAVRSILDIGSSSGNVKKELEDQLQIQKKVISELEEQYKSAKAVFDALNKSGLNPEQQAQRKEASNLYKRVRWELNDEKKGLEELESQYKKLSGTEKNYMTQIRQVANEMAKLVGEGKKESEQYHQLEEKLKKLGTAYNTVYKEKQLLTKGGDPTVAGIMSGLSGIAGAFSAGQGVVSLFVKDNERLAAIQTKLQAAMSITIGLQQVSNTLHATSAFRIKTVTQVTQLWTGAINKLTIALGGSRIAAQALMGALTLGLSVAIGFAVDWLNKYIDKQRKAAEEQAKFARSVSENSAQSIADFERLRKTYLKLGDTLSEKTDFIIKHRDEFKKLGVEINGVNDADNLFINNAEAFKNSIMLRAQYIAAMELASEKYKSALEKMMNAESREKTPTKWDKIIGSNDFFSRDGKNIMLNRQAVSSADKMRKEAEKDRVAADALVNQGIAFNEQYLEKINEANLKSLENLKTGTKDWWEGYKKMQQDLLDEFTNKEVGSEDWKKVKAERDKAVQALKAWDKPKEDHKAEREAQQRLDAEKKLNEELRRLALEKQKFDIETRQKEIDLMEDGFSKRDAQLKLNYDKERQEAKEFAEKKLKEQQEIEKQGYIKTHGNHLGFSPVTTEIVGLPADIQAQIQQLYASAQSALDRGNELLARDLQDFTAEQKNRLASSLQQQLYDVEQYYKERLRQAAGNEEQIKILTENKELEIFEINTRYALGRLEFEKNVTLERMKLSDKRYLFETDREKEILKITEAYARKRLELLEKLQAEGIQDLEQEIEEMEVEIQGLNKELDKIPVKKIQEALAGIKSIAGALSGLDGEIGGIFSAVGSAVDSISASFKAAKSETKDYAGQISTAISGVVDIINMVSSASARRKQAEKEFYQNQIALAHEYALALNDVLLSQSQGAGFVTNYAGQINDAFSAMTDGANHYYDALSKLSEGKAKIDLRNAIDWGSVAKGLTSGAAAGAAIGSMIVPGIGTIIGGAIGGLVGGIVGLFGGKKKKDVFGGLLEIFPELVDETGNLNKELAKTLVATKQLDDNTTQLVQNALDWADAIETAGEQIKGIVIDLAGDLGNNIRNALVDAWKSGEDASKKMFAAASESLGKFVEELLYSAVFSDIFKQFQDDLVASLNPLTGDQDVVDDYDRLMKALGERDDFYIASLEAINKRAGEYGFDFKGTGKQQAAETGGFKAVSQDSFDLWLGQFTAIRIHTSGIYDTLIRENEIMNSAFSRIEENTRISADCLKDIRTFAKKWESEGIKVL